MATATFGGVGSLACTVTGAVGTLNSFASTAGVTFNNGCMVKNPTGGATIYLGGSDCSATLGTPLAGGESISLNIDNLSRVYAFIAAGSQAVTVLYAK